MRTTTADERKTLLSRLKAAVEAHADEVVAAVLKDIRKPEQEITVKGIAYPVKTYSVVDLIETLQKEKEHIEARLKGFNLKIDFDKLNYTDKLYAREMLLKAMAKLEPAPDEADSPD